MTPRTSFKQICVNSGGIELQGNEHTTILRLKEFTQMMRERYILEYPRTPNEKPGVHIIAVSYKKKSNLYITATGITVPIASEDEKESRKTIQSDLSRTPEFGSRNVLLPQTITRIARSPPENPVKPQKRENPRQSSTFAWRISYAPTAILNTEKEKAPAKSGLFQCKSITRLIRRF